MLYPAIKSVLLKTVNASRLLASRFSKSTEGGDIMNEWTAAVWAAVSAMIAALVLSMIVVLGSLARESVRIQQTDDAAVAIVKEIRRFGTYNDTKNLYPQDVMTAISEFKGMPVIYVDTLEGDDDDFSLVWDDKTPPEDYKTKHLTSIFPTDARYDSSLILDANGAVVRIEFRRP
jgi:hypothetical protein